MHSARTHSLLFLLISNLIALNACASIALQTRSLDDSTYDIHLAFALPQGDALYADYLDISTDHPDIILSPWKFTHEPAAHYDPQFKETKQQFRHPFSITLSAHAKGDVDDAHLLVTYYQKSHKKIELERLPLPFAKHTANKNVATQSPAHYEQNARAASADADKPLVHESWSCYFSDMMETAESIWLRLLVAFVLGLLLSLTPCIYPMIPITVGILQAQGSKSIGRNFLLALSYAMGIATTFALLGLLAAFTGQLFGNLLVKPLFVFTIVALLVYLALSMIGLYEMYTPRFLQNNSSKSRSGSFVSAFLFGAASGTVASPCLSPGLVLLLTIVTTLNSAVLGFFLLFAFGIGLGMPLLIIGTFSGSLAVLPRAGMWMIEVKKIFGFIMLFICLYFLNNILPWHVIVWLATLLCFASGFFYLYSARTTLSRTWRIIENVLGIAFIASAIILSAKAYQLTFKPLAIAEQDIWETDYLAARARAQDENKPVLVYVTGQFCTICKAINKKIFGDAAVRLALAFCVPVKVDGCDDAPEITELQKRYHIIGVPTYLLLDAHSGDVIKRWDSKLYERTAQDYAQELQALATTL